MAVDFQPLQSSRRSDEVFEQLRSRILSGAFPSGSRLPTERELAEALAVNRGSVREALKRLEFLELVDVRHGHGTFARDPSGSSALQLVEALLRDRRTVTPELLRQLLEFRRHMTSHVLELAAERRSDEQLARARALLEREAAADGDSAASLQIDIELNAILGEASGNLMYQLIANLFTKLLQRLGPLYYNERRDHARSLATHRRLLAAIEQRDAAAARAVLEEILGYSEAAIFKEAERLEAEGLIGPSARNDPS